MTQEKSSAIDDVMELISRLGLDGMAEAFTVLLNEGMRLERSKALCAEPYERTEDRKGYANGYKDKSLATRLGKLKLKVPQVRGKLEFYPSAIEKGVRSERALKLALAEMYVKGVSTRRVTDVLELLCGDLTFSSTEVSRATEKLDTTLQAWRDRPLGEFKYLIVDARYEKVRVEGSVVSCAVLIAVGIDAEGRRSILGTSVSLSEAEVHWRSFLEDLQMRGLHGLQGIVSDKHAGLHAALSSRFPGVPWQRCQFHLQRNASHQCSSLKLRSEVATAIRDIFNAPMKIEAERRLNGYVQDFRKRSKKLADWLEESVPESLTIYAFPAHHRKRLRTSNMLENVNKQIRRRTAVAGLFPNTESVLRLVSAILMEISEEWESGRIYLTLDDEQNEN